MFESLTTRAGRSYQPARMMEKDMIVEDGEIGKFTVTLPTQVFKVVVDERLINIILPYQ